MLTNQGCPECDPKHTKSISIDKGNFSTAVPPNTDFYIVVEPESGYLVSNKKKTTVFVALTPEDTLPFPDLEKLATEEQLIPVFSYSEEFSIDNNKFAEQFGFVSDNSYDITVCVVLFAIFAALSAIFAIVCLIFYCTKIRPQEKGEGIGGGHNSTVSLESNHNGLINTQLSDLNNHTQ